MVIANVAQKLTMT